ncbi:MAG: cupredoxin domain-containing protein [Nanoarchaeota archaeon]|nr:cupredoxin domain-containing protein [Nanoarchaeota archaeon]
MGNKAIYIGVIVLILVAGFFLIKSPNVNGEVTSGGTGDIQKVTIGFKNYNYDPQVVKVKANQPVRIYLDDSVYGCYRAFTIREFGISKFLQSTNDYVEFTPTKPGTYAFSCSMGMGTGKLIVE